MSTQLCKVINELMFSFTLSTVEIIVKKAKAEAKAKVEKRRKVQERLTEKINMLEPKTFGLPQPQPWPQPRRMINQQ